MTTNHRYKSPILHRSKQQQQDQRVKKSPNIYTNQFEKYKASKQETSRNSRESIGRSKYKKLGDKKLLNLSEQQKERLNVLIRQNNQLKKQIIELKVHQFYQFDDKKLKQLLIEVETLKKQLKKCKQQLEESQLQNDYLRRANTELKTQLQRSQDTKLYEKRYKESSSKNGSVSPRNIREDQQLTQRITQRPILSSSNPYDDFEDCRILLASKSTTKKEKTRKVKDVDNQYLLLLQSKQRILQPTSPRNSTKPYISSKERDTKQLLIYKSKKNNPKNQDL